MLSLAHAVAIANLNSGHTWLPAEKLSRIKPAEILIRWNKLSIGLHIAEEVLAVDRWSRGRIWELVDFLHSSRCHHTHVHMGRTNWA